MGQNKQQEEINVRTSF